jgi:hypothetical protein
MNRSFFLRACGVAAFFAACLFGPVAAYAASPVKRAAAEEARVVDLFDGIKSGDIEVKVIPKDAKEGTVTIRNKTGQLLSIKVPEALAAVPVLAQAGWGPAGGNGLGNGFGNGNANNANQGIGGGLTGGGNFGGGNWGGGGPGGFFNIGRDKVGKFKLVAVCLDHGLADPNPRVPYELVPIESYAKDPAVAEVLKLLVRGKLDQPAAQAACWHLQNGLSWKELAAKIGAKHLNGRTEAYFKPSQLDRALAATRAAQNKAESTPRSQAVESVATR